MLNPAAPLPILRGVMHFSLAPLPLAQAAVPVNGARIFSSGLVEQFAGDTRFLVWFSLVQVAIICAIWIAARTLVPKREINSFGQYDRRDGAGLAKSLALYLACAALVALALFLIRFAGSAFQSAALTAVTQPVALALKWQIVMGAIALVALIFALILPILIFNVRLFRAIILLAVIALLSTGAGWALNRMLERPMEARLAGLRKWQAGGNSAVSMESGAQQEVSFSEAERTGYDTSKPMAERKAAVRKMFDLVQQIFAELPPGDDQALAEYNRKNTRYEALLKTLRGEIAANPQAGQ